MLEEITAIDAAHEAQRTGVGLGFWHPFVAVFQDKQVLKRFGLGASLFFWQNTVSSLALDLNTC
jgi:hypothetical protein